MRSAMAFCMLAQHACLSVAWNAEIWCCCLLCLAQRSARLTVCNVIVIFAYVIVAGNAAAGVNCADLQNLRHQIPGKPTSHLTYADLGLLRLTGCRAILLMKAYASPCACRSISPCKQPRMQTACFELLRKAGAWSHGAAAFSTSASSVSSFTAIGLMRTAAAAFTSASFASVRACVQDIGNTVTAW